jgi:hypothetical protein
MKDQLLAIAILLSTGGGLFWIRHLVLTIAKRNSMTAPMHEHDDRRRDGFADDESMPIAWLTTADIEALPAAEGLGTAPPSLSHPDRAIVIGE